MTPIRYLYPGGIEAVLTERGWRLLHGAREELVYPSVARVSETLHCLPVVMTGIVANSDSMSVLLDHSSNDLFGFLLSDLMNRPLDAATLFEVHHVAYALGATGYHCQQLAECYASISKSFARIQEIPGTRGTDRAVFGNHPAPYYEFDACVTAGRRLFEAGRHLLWKVHGNGGPAPDGFWTTLQELRASSGISDALSEKLEETWSLYGRKLSDYRNCIIHHVPVDFGMTSAWMQRHELGVCVTRIRIPDNPEAQAREAFSFAGSLDALEYCVELVGALAKFAKTVVDATAMPAARAEG